jgi:hypothetical protein
MKTKTFDFFGDVLAVNWTGSVWVSPVNGQQHARPAAAVRAECEAYLQAGGNDPADYADAIQDAIGAAESGGLEGGA